MRTKATIAITAVMALLLGWQHLDGGVPAHHLLADPALPALSNWWGLLTLPALAWRSEFGSVHYWERVVTEAALAVGADGLWPLIVD